MRTVLLDYVRQPPSVSLWAVVVLAMLGVGAAFSLASHLSLREEAQQLARKRDLSRSHLSGTADATSSARNEAAKLKPELDRARGVIRELSVPWHSLFGALEAQSTERVSLLQVRPNARQGVINILAEAKDFPSLLDYAERLGKESLFAEVTLVNHQTQQQDPLKPVRFELALVWNRN